MKGLQKYATKVFYSEKEKSKTFILKAIEKFELKNIEKTIL